MKTFWDWWGERWTFTIRYSPTYCYNCCLGYLFSTVSPMALFCLFVRENNCKPLFLGEIMISNIELSAFKIRLVLSATRRGSIRYRPWFPLGFLLGYTVFGMIPLNDYTRRIHLWYVSLTLIPKWSCFVVNRIDQIYDSFQMKRLTPQIHRMLSWAGLITVIRS